MVKSGSFKVGQGSTAGRFGAGIGQGLAEALPKEVAQQRLASGLKNFSQNAQGLSPLEAATQLFSIPGVTPQMVQTLPQLLQQQQLAQSLGGQSQDQDQTPPFPSLPKETPSSGLTTRPGIEATRKGFIPPTLQDRDARAKQLYDSNPKRFGNDPNRAIEFADQEIAREQQINQGYQSQRSGEKSVQRDVQSNLQTQASLLGSKVPGNVYSDIEQRAIRSVLPKEEGGENLTDEEAKIKYGGEMDSASRQYDALRAIGDPTWSFLTPKEMMRNIKSTREQFKKRSDLRNFADTLISENKLSPSKAYYLAYPNSDIPELEKSLSKLPDVNIKTTFEKGFPVKHAMDYQPEAILHQLTPKLAKDMGKEGSPLAIAEDLQSKGYDPSIFLNYLSENRDKLDLTGRQVDELNKPRSWFPNLNDIWLFKLSNQDKLVD